MTGPDPAPLRPGDVVIGRATHVASFGLFLDHQGHELLLLIPETSWIASYAGCDQLAGVGDEFRVRVLGHPRKNGQYAVSHKVVFPEGDPWSGRWELRTGDVLEARVLRHVGQADRCGGPSRCGWRPDAPPGAVPFTPAPPR